MLTVYQAGCQLCGGQVFQKQMEEFVKACPVCLKTTIPPKVPLPRTPLFGYPWN